MVTKSNSKDVPVKLDGELKKKVDEFISRGENRFDYPSIKNFVDKAVLRYLKEVKAWIERKKL